ncbi:MULTISPECIES: helix-turn-helix domain-containing protein [Sphingomonas]|uniref:helix-turn-helix domain-containing protein n=1 Tax=Sphingomonas TaxID=13687 RepID=UPI000DEF03B8|nr:MULTISPECIES: DUF4019 domain-containing protein [Sphingomonas]
MTTDLHRLTEKEKQTLRLIVRGHDAKSTARELGLSVHTINERLRDARRKLAVSSSREAARLLLDQEGADPEKLGDKALRDDEVAESSPSSAVADQVAPDAQRRALASRLIEGAIAMSLLFGLFLLAAAQPSSPVTLAPATSQPVAEGAAAAAARGFLELGDAARWQDAYAATSTSFRSLNTLQNWTGAAQKVRVPLGAVVSRTFVAESDVPAPPAGVHVVQYRTRFASGREAIETVSLDQEQGAWKVVGIYVE